MTKNRFKNLILKAGSWYRHMQLFPQEGKQDNVPYGYEKIPVTFNFGHKYYPYNVKDPYKYWTPQFVHEVDKFKHYLLDVQFMPKKFDNNYIKWGVGVIETDEVYKYGYFTCKIKFPLGAKFMWPAFWLYGFDSEVYSEIDIVEAYSKDNMYGGFTNFKSNVHYQLNEDVWVNTGEHKHPLPESSVLHEALEAFGDYGNFVKFSLHWTKDFMRFYYDGYLVREIVDKNILDKMVEMKMVINNSVENNIDASYFSRMEVKDIEVWKEIK